MEITDLKLALEDIQQAGRLLESLGVQDFDKAHRALVSIADNGVPLDLLNEVVRQLQELLPPSPDPDLGLVNLSRFIISSRSPMSLATLMVRDSTALPIMVDIFSFSQMLSELLIADPESYDLVRLTDGQPVSRETLAAELNNDLQLAPSHRIACNRLRLFHHRELLRIGYGDLVRRLDVAKTTQQLTMLAEVILSAAFDYCQKELFPTATMLGAKGAMAEPGANDNHLTGGHLKGGRPKGGRGTGLSTRPQPENACIGHDHDVEIAMVATGELGARRMDYSSPVHLMFVCSGGEGSFPGERSDRAQQFADLFRELVADVNEYGSCYTIEFDRRGARDNHRLVNLSDAIRYFDQQLTPRDRLDFVSARRIRGSRMVADRLLDAVNQQICRTYLSQTDLVELHALQRRIQPHHSGDGATGSDTDMAGESVCESGLGTDLLEFRNVRRDPGGLGDLEFALQYLLMILGQGTCRDPDAAWTEHLHRLEQEQILTQQECSVLQENYAFLKIVSHRLQLFASENVDVLPSSVERIRRLQTAVDAYFGSTDQDELMVRIHKRVQSNRAILAHLLQVIESSEDNPFRAFVLGTDEPDSFEHSVHLRHLSNLGFRNPPEALKAIGELAVENHRFLPTRRCRYFFSTIVMDLIGTVARYPDPDSTLGTLVDVSNFLGGKSTLWELFHQSPPCLELYVRLCALTPYLATILKTNPGMIDELMDSLTHACPHSIGAFRSELDAACRNSTDVLPVVLGFRNSKHLQIGVSQLIRRRPLEQLHRELSDVAECCLLKIAESEYQSLVEKHGPPMTDHGKPCDWTLVLGGKIGGREPNYHSKVRCWMVYESDGETLARGDRRTISNQHFFSLLGSRFSGSVARSGEHGRLYELETLPEQLGGGTSCAVSTSSLTELACRQNDDQWNLFVSQCRPVGWCSEFDEGVEKILRDAIAKANAGEADWDSCWQRRLENEESQTPFNLKRSRGGTRDIEVMTQFLFVSNADKLLVDGMERPVGTRDMLTCLVKAGVLSGETGRTLEQGYRFLREIELCLRLMDLSNRHDLPVTRKDPSGMPLSTGEGQTDPEAELSAGCEDSNALDVVVETADQARLKTLLSYDRFDSLVDDVRDTMNENRRLVTETMGRGPT